MVNGVYYFVLCFIGFTIVHPIIVTILSGRVGLGTSFFNWSFLHPILFLFGFGFMSL